MPDVERIVAAATRLEAEVRAELVDVAFLLFEIAARTAEVAQLPVVEMPAAMEALATDLDAVMAKLAGGEDR